MSLDAMQWVWNESRCRGNARLVLLAVADKAPGADCTARMGTTELRNRLYASKSVVVRAVDAALDSGELVIDEPAAGSRAARYKIPGAVDYVRPDTPNRGTESGPVADEDRSQIETGNAEQGSQIRTGSENTRGPESVPGGSQIRPPTGPESGPHYETSATTVRKQASSTAAADERDPCPGPLRPLRDRLTAAGIRPSWALQPQEWIRLHAMLRRSGEDMLADAATRAAQRTEIGHARYLLKVWADLPPLPADGTPPAAPQPGGADVIPLAAAHTGRSKVQQHADNLAAALARRNAAQEAAQ